MRQAAILKAEGEKQAVVLDAEGRREAALRKTHRGTQTSGEGRSRGNTHGLDAIATGNIQAINYFGYSKRYLKALKSLAKAPNQKVILMPLEAASVIGSIAGLAEITGDAFNRNSLGGMSKVVQLAEVAGRACHIRSTRLVELQPVWQWRSAGLTSQLLTIGST